MICTSHFSLLSRCSDRQDNIPNRETNCSFPLRSFVVLSPFDSPFRINVIFYDSFFRSFVSPSFDTTRAIEQCEILRLHTVFSALLKKSYLENFVSRFSFPKRRTRKLSAHGGLSSERSHPAQCPFLCPSHSSFLRCVEFCTLHRSPRRHVQYVSLQDSFPDLN